MLPLSPAERRLLTDLNAGWHDLCERHRRLPRGWATRWPDLHAAADLAACIERPFGRSDACLFALLSLSSEGDSLAGRTVLQSLLPGILRMAGRDPMAELSDYVAHLWCGIQTYPLARRPRRVANNLELDTLKAVRRERPRLSLLPMVDDDLDRARATRERPLDPLQPSARSVIETARDVGLVDDYTSRVLCTVYADGLTGREAAARLDTSVDLVRWRCSKAVRALARHRDLLAAVA